MNITKETVNANTKCTIRIANNFAKYISPTVNLHWHSRSEICYIISGSCHFYINGRSIYGKSGDIIVFKSGDIHSYSQHSDDYTCYISLFDPILIYNNHIKLPYIKTHITKEDLEKHNITSTINKLFNDFLDEYINMDKYYEATTQSHLIQIYATLSRYFEDNNNNSPNGSKSFETFQKILDYISENYAHDISLDDLSAILNYSTSTISHMFPTFIGMSFKKYLNKVRINNAFDLLKDTSINITDIATQCGYNNVRAFNNAFKTETGVTPTEIRAIIKNK